MHVVDVFYVVIGGRNGLSAVPIQSVLKNRIYQLELILINYLIEEMISFRMKSITKFY